VQGIVRGDRVSNDLVYEFDAVVIGSGISGCIVAQKLQESGYSTCLIEEGDLLKFNDYSKNFSCYQDYGLRYGLGNCIIKIQQGRALGGGFNWVNSLIEPDHFILGNWHKKFGIKWAGDRDWIEKKLIFLENLFSLNKRDEQDANRNNLVFKALLETISVNLRKKWRVISLMCERNEREIPAPLLNFLNHGGTLLLLAGVKRIIHNGFFAQGVDGKFYENSRISKNSFRLKSKVTVLCCGAINTNKLIKDSEIPDKAGIMGRGIFLNPCIPIISLFNKRIEVWEGIPSIFYSEWVGKGKNLMLEPVSLSPFFISRLLDIPGEQKWEALNSFRRLSMFLLELRDENSSCNLKNSIFNKREIDYNLPDDEITEINKYIDKITDGLKKIGAKVIYLPEEKNKRMNMLFSYSPQGGCRMGDDPSLFAVRLSGETYSLRNLYVADASTFPSPAGSQSSIITMLNAIYIADNIITSLRRKD